MRKVMVFGTFDVFHKGHENFLKQARKLGKFLIVVVACDKTVEKVKKHQTRNSEKRRLLAIRRSGLAEVVILGSLLDKYVVIKKYKPDIIGLGYDQDIFTNKLKKKLKEFGLDKTRIVRLKSYYPKKYKSSLLR